MTTITSRQHPIVQAFRRAETGDERLALVDGWHLLHDAAHALARVDTVAIAGSPPDAEAGTLLARLAGQGTTVVQVANTVMDALSPVRTPTGVAALVERPAVDFAQLLRPYPPLILVGIDMQDPGNVGAMIRAAEAGGASGVALAGSSADPWGWKALRAAMGSTFRLPVIRMPEAMALVSTLRKKGVKLIATAPRRGTDLYATDFTAGTAIVFGGEGAGLDESVLLQADARVSIPMNPPVESLNVAVTAALLVYEARRQRAK